MKITHPYRGLTGGQWLRGNLHTHTTASDGSRPIRQVVNDYRKRGYDFLMISDHDIHTGPAEYRKLKAGDILLIPGNEISRGGPHMLHVNSSKRIDPYQPRQKVIQDAVADRGFVVLNHPNWQDAFDHCPITSMQQWIDYTGLEIYNGVIGRLSGSPYATNKWDMMLTAGRRLWGFANDDSHKPEDVELGWNIAYTKKRTVSAVVDALAAGKFYGSTGVTINTIRVRKETICIETDNASRIVALRDGGRRFATVDGNSIEVTPPEGSTYVRFECWGDGEKFAWTQPFFVEQ